MMAQGLTELDADGVQGAQQIGQGRLTVDHDNEARQAELFSLLRLPAEHASLRLSGRRGVGSGRSVLPRGLGLANEGALHREELERAFDASGPLRRERAGQQRIVAVAQDELVFALAAGARFGGRRLLYAQRLLALLLLAKLLAAERRQRDRFDVARAPMQLLESDQQSLQFSSGHLPM